MKSRGAQSGNKYRLKAYDTSVLVEIRTGRQNTSTKIMVADDYGRLQKESTGDKND